MNPEEFLIFKNSPKFNKARYEIGRVAEIEIIDTLKKYFDDPSICPLPEGDIFDFCGRKKKIELKSRSVYRLTYDDTAIGMGKIHKSKLMYGFEDHYYVFKFINGLYYWRYNPDSPLRLGSLHGVQHYFIPVGDLIKIK